MSVPAVEKDRYYAVQLEDGNTFNYGYIGSRATGNEAGDYMVVGPDWKGETPDGHQEGVPVRRRSSRWPAIARSCSTPDDMPNVKKIQAGYKAQPLSAYLEQPAPPPAPKIDFPKIDKELVKTQLLRVSRLRAAVRPAGAGREGIRAEARQIGIGAGKTLRLRRAVRSSTQARDRRSA